MGNDVIYNKTDIIERCINRIREVYENEAVKKAIKEVLKKNIYENILSLKGNVNWDGNLDEMRQQRISY